MTLLDDIITASTDDAVSTSNLLRKVQIVAHRLQADEITKWVQSELGGYAHVDDLPKYRADLVTNVKGLWSGPMGSRMLQALGAGRMPEEAARVLFRVNLNQPIAELEDLAGNAGKRDLGIPWDPEHVAQYNAWGDEGIVPRIEFMGVLSADRVVTRAMIRGVIDSARNTALEFALKLQSADPDAGSLDGPTIADAPVQRALTIIHNHIYGDGALVAQGENIRQKSKVVKNDLPALLAAARELGLTSEGSEELARAVLTDEAERPSRIKKLLRKVSEGSYLVGTGAAGGVAATQLSALIAAYLG